MKKQSVKQLQKKAEPHRIFKNNLLSEKSIMLWRIRATAILILYSFIDGGLFVFFPFFAVAFGIFGLSAYIFAIKFYFPLLMEYSYTTNQKFKYQRYSTVSYHRDLYREFSDYVL